MWRTPGEGLELTSLGSKDLRGGNICHLVVGIRFSIARVVVEECTKVNGEYSSHFAENVLQRAPLGRVAVTGKDKVLLLQDNDPRKIVHKQPKY